MTHVLWQIRSWYWSNEFKICNYSFWSPKDLIWRKITLLKVILNKLNVIWTMYVQKIAWTYPRCRYLCMILQVGSISLCFSTADVEIPLQIDRILDTLTILLKPMHMTHLATYRSFRYCKLVRNVKFITIMLKTYQDIVACHVLKI